MKGRRQEVRRIWYGDSGTTFVEGLMGRCHQIWQLTQFLWVDKFLVWLETNVMFSVCFWLLFFIIFSVHVMSACYERLSEERQPLL